MDELVPLVYDELRVIARRQLRRQWGGHTLDTTALVHEAYLKLSDPSRADFHDRAHFLAVAATAMRQILVDYARRRTARKRRGDGVRLPPVGAPAGGEDRAAEMLAVDEALTSLSALDGRLARLVELRFYGGLTVEETAEVLEVSERTVKRDWRKARAFLYRALSTAGAA